MVSDKLINVSVILLGYEDADQDIQSVWEWQGIQGVDVELIRVGIGRYPEKNYNVKYCVVDEGSSELERVYAAAKLCSGKYVTWINIGEVFIENALMIMAATLEKNHSAKLCCAYEYFCDAYGEKSSMPARCFGSDRVIQPVSRCFLIERLFLLQQLSACQVDWLWEQFLWNRIFEKGYTICSLQRTLLKTRICIKPIEQEKNFKFMLRYLMEHEKIADLQYLMKLISNKCGEDYLLKRLVGLFYPAIETQWQDGIRPQVIPEPTEARLSYAPSCKDKTLVLNMKYGGLGDSLFYSHIPRIAKESGKYDKVYISRLSAFRNSEIYQLVFEQNPFIDGISDEIGEQYELTNEDRQAIENDEGNLLDYIMLGLGLEDGKRYHEPEIYYKPKVIPELIRKTVFDPNYVSNAADPIQPKDVYDFLIYQGMHVDYMMTQRDKCVSVCCENQYRTKSLLDFCDVLYTAEKIICFPTGTATLCAALNKKAIVLYGGNMKKQFLHSKRNYYVRL